MAFSTNKQKYMSEINVTPFVDVMLVLLIIFMVTAPMMIRGANVSLPEADLDAIAANEEILIVTVTANKEIYINDYKTTIESLSLKLEKIFERRSDKQLYLKADKKIDYGTVVTVMAEIKKAGVEKLGMLTDPVADTKKGSKK